MMLTFYLQYLSYNDESFDVDDNYYQDSNDYIKQLEDSYNQTKDIIFEAMSSGSYMDKKTYKMTATKNTVKKDKFAYAKTSGTMYDESMNEMDEKNIFLSTAKDIFVTKLSLELPFQDEEFEMNWKMFIDSTKKIMDYDGDEDWKFIHQPKKDIYFSYQDDKGETKYGKMINCRLLETSKDMTENVLLIEKLVLIKNLE